MPANQAGPAQDHHYYAFEVNYGGNSLTNHAQFEGRHDFSWGNESCYTATTLDTTATPGTTVVILELFWSVVLFPVKCCPFLTKHFIIIMFISTLSLAPWPSSGTDVRHRCQAQMSGTDVRHRCQE